MIAAKDFDRRTSEAVTQREQRVERVIEKYSRGQEFVSVERVSWRQFSLVTLYSMVRSCQMCIS